MQAHVLSHTKDGMNLSERLKTARLASGLTQKELAQRANVDQSVISNIERGVAAGSTRLAAIAEALGASTDWLAMGRGAMNQSHVANTVPVVSASTRRAPVISWVQAGAWTETIDLYAPGYADAWEDVDAKDGPSVFWLKVVGDSMTAPYGISVPEGFLIKVDPDRQPENGCLVVAKLADSQEATFKKLVLDAGQKFLKPLNPSYPAIQVNGNCRIVGVVTEIKLKL